MKDNRLFNALGGLDDSHFRAEELECLTKIGENAAVKRKPAKKIIIAAIAAAAVLVLGLMVGFYNAGHPDYVLEAKDGTTMYYDVHLKTFDIPEEYIKFEMNGNIKVYDFNGVMVEKRPSELFAEFGLTPLTSENFTEEFDYTPLVAFTYPNGEDFLMQKYPWVCVQGNTVDFGYVLYDKVIDEEILFGATYLYNSHHRHHEKFNDKVFEWIDLKGGVGCYINDSGAVFSYDGAMYSINFFEPNKHDFELVKQVLVDLGLL